MRLTIQLKLLAGFAVVVALMLVVGLFAVARLGSDNHHLGRLASRVVPSTRAVGDINALMNKYRKDQLHYIVARPSDRPLGVPGSIVGDLQDDLTLMRSSLRAYEANGLVEDARDRQLLESFRRDFGGYVSITAGFRRQADLGRPFQAGAVVGDGAGDVQWDKLKELIASWNNHKVDTAAVEQDASRRSYSFSVFLIIALLAAAVGIAVAVAVVLARRTTRAVREIGAAAKAIAQGDIDQRVAVRSRDELGEMAGDFDAMIGYLRSTVAIAESIAEGNLDVEVRPRSESDALGNALAVMTASLRRLVSENEVLLAASRSEAAHQIAQNEQLRELDVMKDEFVALVSHELRTPLTAIQGYTELVLDGTTGELNDEQRTALASVDRNSARLFRLINDLLFVAQVNAGKLNVAIEDVDLAAVAADAVADARPRAEAAEVALELECTLTPTVRADRVRLAQVFDNLISNAIKFTPPGGRVGLSVSMVGEEAMIVVADSGMGMTPEDQQRLFTRFFRTKAAAKIQGTGLGLSITKAILDAHRGSISVESKVGEGSRFTITVPTSDEVPAQHDRRSTDLPAAA